MKKLTVITLLLAAAICSACGNTDSPESAPQPDTVTASVTLPAPESDPDKKSETDSETAPEETAALTDDSKSETKETTTSQSSTTTETITTTAKTTSNTSTTKNVVTTTTAKAVTRVTITTTSSEKYMEQQRELERSKYMNGKCGDNITYTLDNDGELKIEGKGEMYDYELGKSPFQFANGSEWNNIPPIRKVIISDGITKIGNNTFYNSVYIKNVVIPNSVISIGDSTFQNCWGITEISLPDSVLTIGNSCFNGCYSIKTFKMSGNIEYVDDWALGNLLELESISFPKGTRFGGWVFENDPKLTIRCYDGENTEKLKKSGCKVEIIEE